MSSQMVLFGQPLIKIREAISAKQKKVILSEPLYHHSEIFSPLF